MSDGAGFRIDFGAQLGGWGRTRGAIGYAFLRVVSAEEREAVLRFGTWEWAQIWLNGVSVYLDRACAAPEQEEAALRLQKGENEVLFKVGVSQRRASVRSFHYDWCILARITDKDGEPMRDLEFPPGE